MQDKERSTRSGTGAHRSLLKYREGCDSSWSWGCLRKKELISPTYRTCILARPQKAPSVSLLMLLRCSFRTSKLSSPWNVSPSIRRMRFRFSSLKSPRPNMFIKPQPFSHEVICAAHNGDSNANSSSVSGSQGTAEEHRKLSIPELSREGSWVRSPKQTHPGTGFHYREITECNNSSSSLPLSAFLLNHWSFSSIFTLHPLSSADTIWTNTVKRRHYFPYNTWFL